MSSIVLDNTFKTSPFITTLFHSASKEVSAGQRSETGVASKLSACMHRIVNCIEQLTVN